MSISRIVGGMFSVGLIALSAGLVSAQDFPNKPIRIFTSLAGGASDVLARLTAQGISGPLGQPVVVDNRVPLIAIDAVAKAPPDGYTLLLYGTQIWVAPLLRDNVSWDPIRDFSPISLMTIEPYLLVVHPSLPVKSVKELISLAKARPGELNYGSGGAGSASHLGSELFKALTGVNIVHIPYKNSDGALFDLTSGLVQVMFPAAGAASPFIKLGRLRLVAVTSAQPSTLFPGLPTVAASGVPGYDTVALNGLLAPAKTPVTIINRLHQEVVRVISRAEVKEKFLASGQEIVGSSPDAFATDIKTLMTKMGKVIKDAGIKGD